MKYKIWQDNGTSVEFESEADSLNDVLDEFCGEAGYLDHADYCKMMGLESSPFNIEPVQSNDSCNDELDICSACNGSAESNSEEAVCFKCNGSGEC